MSDVCLMQFRCMICGRVFWSYTILYYTREYLENDDGSILTMIRMSNPYGYYEEKDIVNFTSDGLPMIEARIIDNQKNCYTHRVNQTMESFL